MSDTVLNGIERSVCAALANDDNVAEAPVALLWPDEARQFEAVATRLRHRVPILTLGDFDPDSGRGPAYWIRCVIAGTVSFERPLGTPIVYLPGYDRGQLRAIETCDDDVAPIVELQYRGAWFSHPNGKDWTLRTLLRHPDRGLGLSIAEDSATNQALTAAVDQLLDEPLARAQVEHVDADYLHGLINPDPIRTLLNWLNDPAGYRAAASEAQWQAFAQQCQHDFGFGPDTDGPLTAAARLGERHGLWNQVWARFAENPTGYEGVIERLGAAKPLDLRPLAESWPQDNEQAESDLRKALGDLASLTSEEGVNRLKALEERHRARRGWLWAQLDRAPLAFALEQLTRLVDLAAPALPGSGLSALISAYTSSGWQVDDALLRALQAASNPDDRAAVAKAADTVYRPWLSKLATAFQQAATSADAASYEVPPASSPPAGTVVAFVDGLRLDAGHRLARRLTDSGLHVNVESRLAAVPSVTPTAKPAVAPVPEGTLQGGVKLAAALTSSGKDITAPTLRSAIASAGVEVISSDSTGDPAGSGWTELGEIDRRGHELGLRLVDYLDDELDRVARRLRELVDAGWDRIEVVTDHGWMLLPGGMPKAELPVAVSDTKKGRCARLKPGAPESLPTTSWHWDFDVRIAFAPDIHCFEKNKEYEHGGLSPQECVTPQLIVTRAAVAAAPVAIIAGVKWLSLRCRVELAEGPDTFVVDVRQAPADAGSSVAEETKIAQGGGRVSLLVPDETLEGVAAHLVVLDSAGEIVAQRAIRIGVNE